MATALSKFLSVPKNRDGARYLSLALTGAIAVAAALSQGPDGGQFDFGSSKLMETAVGETESKAVAARASDAAVTSIVAFDAKPMSAEAISSFLDRNDLDGLSERLAELGGSPDDVIYSAMEQRSDMMKRMAGRLGDMAESLRANDPYRAQVAHESLTQAIDEYRSVFLKQEGPSEEPDSIESVARKTEALGMVLRVASGFRL